MFKLFFVTCLMLLGSVVRAADADFIMKAHGAAGVTVGMTAAEAAQRLPADRVKKWSPYANISVIDLFASAGKQDKPALRLNLDRKERIWSIEVHDSRYKTSRGITKAATFGELRKAHPEIVIGIQEGEMDRYIQAEIVAEGIHFYLKFSEDLWKTMLRQPDPRRVSSSVIPDTTPIESIMIS